MRIKRFTAHDMAQAMRMVRQDLGAEAVILASSNLPNGGVEITAAIDTNPKKTASASQKEKKPSRQVSDNSKTLEELAKQVEELGQSLERHLIVSEAASDFAARPEVAPLYNHLSCQEVQPEIIKILLDGLMARGGHGLLPRLSIRLKKILKVAEAPKFGVKSPRIWSLIGPTGVGKTTTIAKLAARFSLQQGLNVGMVTVDTFRMAAAEQLKVYGRIMAMQTLVAATASELDQAIKSLSEADLILIDTVGRAPGDADNLEELESILSSVKGLENHLVLACPTREQDQNDVCQGFARFKPKSIVFTKLDETNTFGPILNRVVRTRLPVSYLATGQKVPDDLEEATREGLARRLLPARKDLELFD